jgi:hypothetical protein
MDTSTWLLTGAIERAGYALADYVLNQGDRVVLAARTLDATADLAERHPDTGLALALDVTDPQRGDAIRQAERRFGAIDVLVNNAGIDFHRTGSRAGTRSFGGFERGLGDPSVDQEVTSPREASVPRTIVITALPAVSASSASRGPPRGAGTSPRPSARTPTRQHTSKWGLGCKRTTAGERNISHHRRQQSSARGWQAATHNLGDAAHRERDRNLRRAIGGGGSQVG